MKPLVRTVLLVLALGLVVAACGGDDDGDDGTTTTADGEASDTTADAATTTTAGTDTTTAGGDGTDTTLPLGIDTTVADDREVVADGVVEAGDLVTVHYVGTLDDGEEFDTSRGRDPFEFEVGSGQVIPGFDEGIIGMAPGETKTVSIAVEDAYGEPDPANIIDFPIDEVPEEYREAGLEVVMGNGQPATVLEVTEETVTVDVNHPLAGEALTFELELIEIRR